MSVQAFVGLGANLGDAARTVRDAATRLALVPGVQRCTLSPLYRSAPVEAAGPDFVNAVAALWVDLSPDGLLKALQALEAQFGRERPYRNAPRTLDLDLLLHGDTVVLSERLTVPHPRLHQRAFVLRPLLDLAPDLRAPALGALAPYLAAVADQRLSREQESEGLGLTGPG